MADPGDEPTIAGGLPDDGFAPEAAVRPALRDFYEPFLDELRRSRHGIRVDLDTGATRLCSPTCGLSRLRHTARCAPRVSSGPPRPPC